MEENLDCLGAPTKTDTLRTSRLEIVDKEGNVVATLAAANKGAGLWITGPDGNLVSIYSIKGQTAIGIYDAQGQRDNDGMNLALTMDGNVPTVQFRDRDGEAQHMKLAYIQAAVEDYEHRELLVATR